MSPEDPPQDNAHRPRVRVWSRVVQLLVVVLIAVIGLCTVGTGQTDSAMVFVGLPTLLGPDGYRADGVAAVARTLEHVNLAWASLGWCLRLPGLDQLAQLLADSLGSGPRDIPHRRAHGRHALQAPRRRPADDS